MEPIYNQHQIPRNQYRYGFRPSAEVGCGWVATHNALWILGYETDTEKLIRYYERLLPLIHGNAGTSFWAPGLVFRNWGFVTETILYRRKFDDSAKKADVCILFYRWRKGAKFGAHFVALHHIGNGFVGYNTYRNSAGADSYGHSLEEHIRRQHWFSCILLTIRKPE